MVIETTLLEVKDQFSWLTYDIVEYHFKFKLDFYSWKFRIFAMYFLKNKKISKDFLLLNYTTSTIKI